MDGYVLVAAWLIPKARPAYGLPRLVGKRMEMNIYLIDKHLYNITVRQGGRLLRLFCRDYR